MTNIPPDDFQDIYEEVVKLQDAFAGIMNALKVDYKVGLTALLSYYLSSALSYGYTVENLREIFDRGLENTHRLLKQNLPKPEDM